MARPDVGQVVAWYICTIVACVFLVTRLTIRWRLWKRLYLDDLFVALAAMCLIGDLGIQHYMFNQGMSEFANTTTAEKISQMKLILPGSTLYVTSVWLIKASMVLFYKRLADRTRYQTVYNITLAVLGATWLVLFFDIVFKRYPPKRQWESITNPDLACDATQTMVNYWLTILFNIFTDVIFCLPISQVARLKMPPKQKPGVIPVFLLGGLVVITSIIRAIYSSRNEQMITCTVSMIETAIAIIASCLPVLRTLFFGSHSRTGTYSRRRGYELSSSGGGVHTGAQGSSHKQRTTVSVSQSDIGRGGSSAAVSGDDLSRHDSEDGLVKERGVEGVGIAVRHEYSVHEGERGGR
ncbi:hypothetical protein BJX70DRAFT_128170 [Aspergillus crustosus]